MHTAPDLQKGHLVSISLNTEVRADELFSPVQDGVGNPRRHPGKARATIYPPFIHTRLCPIPVPGPLHPLFPKTALKVSTPDGGYFRTATGRASPRGSIERCRRRKTHHFPLDVDGVEVVSRPADMDLADGSPVVADGVCHRPGDKEERDHAGTLLPGSPYHLRG